MLSSIYKKSKKKDGGSIYIRIKRCVYCKHFLIGSNTGVGKRAPTRRHGHATMAYIITFSGNAKWAPTSIGGLRVVVLDPLPRRCPLGPY